MLNLMYLIIDLKSPHHKSKPSRKPEINTTVLAPPEPLPEQVRTVQPVPSTSTPSKALPDVLEIPKPGSSRSGLSISKTRSESTPKRNVRSQSPSLLSGNVRTPQNKPVIPEEEFSPIELFPCSQTEGIVRWDWQNCNRDCKLLCTKESLPSCPFTRELDVIGQECLCIFIKSNYEKQGNIV
jgi:hypothetical protein